MQFRRARLTVIQCDKATDANYGEQLMVELCDKETGRILGSISDKQLQFLIDQLEEESDTDTDYFIDAATLEMFAEKSIDPQLLTLLRDALGDREGMEIEWKRK